MRKPLPDGSGVSHRADNSADRMYVPSLFLPSGFVVSVEDDGSRRLQERGLDQRNAPTSGRGFWSRHQARRRGSYRYLRNVNS
jgi:hypothetical protein